MKLNIGTNLTCFSHCRCCPNTPTAPSLASSGGRLFRLVPSHREENPAVPEDLLPTGDLSLGRLSLDTSAQVWTPTALLGGHSLVVGGGTAVPGLMGALRTHDRVYHTACTHSACTLGIDKGDFLVFYITY